MIAGFFQRLAARPSAAVAVQAGREVMSFGDLLEQVEARATRLDRDGVRVLASRLDNGPEWIVSDLAALRAAVVHVPIPGFFTEGQHRHVMAATGADALIASRPGGVLLERHPSRPLLMPEGTSKVTFTSGTTGAPKGVCLSAEAQLGVASALVAATSGLGIERHLCALPLPILLENVAGMLAPLLEGATVIAPPLAEVGMSGSSGFDPATLHAAVQRYHAQSVVVLPQMLRGWVDWLRRTGTSAPRSLRLVAVGGAKVGKETVLAARAAGLPAYEGYGLSEGASVQTLNLPGSDRPGSVGRALPHARLRVAGDGEIEISGTLFLGYLGAADKPHPGAWWRSGDIGSIDPDGFVHVHGRKDAVIVTSFGRNVSPEWVESILQSQGCIAGSVVLGAGQPRLGAVLWPARSDTAEEDLAAAVARANRQLPDYAQVGHWTRSRHELSAAAGLATANGRPRRDRIAALYADEIFPSMEHE